ncbi:MAG: hypothetical protein ACI8YQ_005055, partial [Polaribacter sp.]
MIYPKQLKIIKGYATSLGPQTHHQNPSTESSPRQSAAP